MRDNTDLIRVLTAARGFLNILNDRPAWAYHMARWCLGYKACFYLDSLDMAVKDCEKW